MLKRFPNGKSNNNQLLDQFIDLYYSSDQDSCFSNSNLMQKDLLKESRDFSQQVDFDFKSRVVAERIDQINDQIKQL